MTTQLSSDTHDLLWLKHGRVLYINCKGHQSSESIQACLDEMAAQFETVHHPVMTLTNWLEVTRMDDGALLNQLGHRAFAHPLLARAIHVGLNPQEAFENEVASVKTRRSKNTVYFRTMAEAMDYLEPMLQMQ